MSNDRDALTKVASALLPVLESGVLGHGKHQVITERGIVDAITALAELATRTHRDRHQTLTLNLQVDQLNPVIQSVLSALVDEPDESELRDMIIMRDHICKLMGYDFQEPKATFMAVLVIRARKIEQAIMATDDTHREIELKIWPRYFDDVVELRKNHELREKRDREFRVGDVIRFREWDPHGETMGIYTGRTVKRRITYVYEGDGSWGLAQGSVIISLGEIVP